MVEDPRNCHGGPEGDMSERQTNGKVSNEVVVMQCELRDGRRWESVEPRRENSEQKSISWNRSGYTLTSMELVLVKELSRMLANNETMIDSFMLVRIDVMIWRMVHVKDSFPRAAKPLTLTQGEGTLPFNLV